MSRIDELIAEACPSGVPIKMLGELGTIIRGKRFVKADMVDTGTPCIHYGELYTKYGAWATETFSYLEPTLASRLRFAHPGDVIFVSAGETIEDIGKSVAWLGNDEVVIHDALYAFRSPLDPKFVAYFSQTNDFHSQIRHRISSSKVSAISTENLGKVRIPAPPLEVQREIVKVLDIFTKLEMELEMELKAELEARRQQYKYYRDKLLTFSNDYRERARSVPRQRRGGQPWVRSQSTTTQNVAPSRNLCAKVEHFRIMAPMAYRTAFRITYLTEHFYFSEKTAA